MRWAGGANSAWYQIDASRAELVRNSCLLANMQTWRYFCMFFLYFEILYMGDKTTYPFGKIKNHITMADKYIKCQRLLLVMLGRPSYKGVTT